MMPQPEQVCEVYAAGTSISSAALYSSICFRAAQPVWRMTRFKPAFWRTFVPGLSVVPLALFVMPPVFSFSMTTVWAFAAIGTTGYVVLPVLARVGESPVCALYTHTLPRAPPRPLALFRQAALMSLEFGFQQCQVWHAMYLAVAVGNLAGIAVDADDPAVVIRLRCRNFVAHDRLPAASDAADHRLDRPAGRIRVAAATADRQPADLRDRRLSVADADVFRDGERRIAVAVFPLRVSGTALEERLPRVRLVAQRVAQDGVGMLPKPIGLVPQRLERCSEREERRRFDPASAGVRVLDFTRFFDLVPREPACVPNAQKLVGGRSITRQEPVDDISIGCRIAHAGRSCRSCAKGAVWLRSAATGDRTHGSFRKFQCKSIENSLALLHIIPYRSAVA